jgi:hypothetical protein
VLTITGRTALTYTGYMNGESFQQDGITTVAGRQYTAFWDQSGYVNLSRRQLPGGGWQNLRLTDYATTSTDSHNTISIGISRQDGTIHLAFDMHSSVLRYRRSVAGLATSPATAAWQAGSFGAVRTTLTGAAMPTMTYPQFLTTPAGKLQLALRTGTSGAVTRSSTSTRAARGPPSADSSTGLPRTTTRTFSASSTTAPGCCTRRGRYGRRRTRARTMTCSTRTARTTAGRGATMPVPWWRPPAARR